MTLGEAQTSEGTAGKTAWRTKNQNLKGKPWVLPKHRYGAALLDRGRENKREGSGAIVYNCSCPMRHVLEVNGH